LTTSCISITWESVERPSQRGCGARFNSAGSVERVERRVLVQVPPGARVLMDATPVITRVLSGTFKHVITRVGCIPISRQIQALHDNNWVSRQPFSISLANFRPDNQLAEIVKRHFLFHYGPPSSPSLFSRHPFAPVLTSKSVREVSENIMYISWRATQFLPEVPVPNTRAVVLCASNDFQPWSSSISAAQKDSIKAYRLPLEKHVRFSSRSNSSKKRARDYRTNSAICLT
uniref:COesterase domain-containing protein n=1 Tax=Heligmosomoides polygyrus TaxID=6339 RepID=A0A183FP46_HELPZ